MAQTYIISRGQPNDNPYWDMVAKLESIGITVDDPSGLGSSAPLVFTFPDGKSVRTPNMNTGFWNRWFIADAKNDFIYLTDCSEGNPQFNAPWTNTNDRQAKTLCVVSELLDGTLYATAATGTSSRYPNGFFNVSSLNVSNIEQNDPSKNDIILLPLAGDFITDSNNPDGTGKRYIFKNLFVNYERWFSFGDIIKASNGDKYVGIGWVLHKLGGVTNPEKKSPLSITIEEIEEVTYNG